MTPAARGDPVLLPCTTDALSSSLPCTTVTLSSCRALQWYCPPAVHYRDTPPPAVHYRDTVLLLPCTTDTVILPCITETLSSCRALQRQCPPPAVRYGDTLLLLPCIAKTLSSCRALQKHCPPAVHYGDTVLLLPCTTETRFQLPFFYCILIFVCKPGSLVSISYFLSPLLWGEYLGIALLCRYN